MLKISKILNIALITLLFIFSTECMKNNINLPNEIIAAICDFSLGKFPDNRKEFTQIYKKVLNLRLVNKKFKDSIDKYCKHDQIWNQFDDHLVNIIKDKNLNIKDELLLAVKSGSKKYFEQLPDKDLTTFKKNYDEKDIKKFIQTILDSVNINYPKSIGKIMIQKVIRNKNIQKNISDLYKNPDCFFSFDQMNKFMVFMNDFNNNNKFKTDMTTNRDRQKSLKNFVLACQLPLIIFSIDILNFAFNKIKEEHLQLFKYPFITLSLILLIYAFYNPSKTAFNNKQLFMVNGGIIMLYAFWYFWLSDYCGGDSLFEISVKYKTRKN